MGLYQSGPDSSNWKAAKGSLPPAWVDQIETVEEDIIKIQTKGKASDLIQPRMPNYEVVITDYLLQWLISLQHTMNCLHDD